MVRKHTNENCVVYDYALYVMAKTAQASDLNVHANLLSKLTGCHQLQMELIDL